MPPKPWRSSSRLLLTARLKSRRSVNSSLEPSTTTTIRLSGVGHVSFAVREKGESTMNGTIPAQLRALFEADGKSDR